MSTRASCSACIPTDTSCHAACSPHMHPHHRGTKSGRSETLYSGLSNYCTPSTLHILITSWRHLFNAALYISENVYFLNHVMFSVWRQKGQKAAMFTLEQLKPEIGLHWDDDPIVITVIVTHNWPTHHLMSWSCSLTMGIRDGNDATAHGLLHPSLVFFRWLSVSRNSQQKHKLWSFWYNFTSSVQITSDYLWSHFRARGRNVWEDSVPLRQGNLNTSHCSFTNTF